MTKILVKIIERTYKCDKTILLLSELFNSTTRPYTHPRVTYIYPNAVQLKEMYESMIVYITFL